MSEKPGSRHRRGVTSKTRFLFVHAWRGFALAEWYLREALRSRCTVPVEVAALDLAPEGIPAADSLARAVAVWEPDVVGFSCHYWSIAPFLEAAATVRRLRPETVIVLGGPQVDSAAAAEAALLRAPAVDLVVRGPGELALPRLIEAISAGSALDEVPGLSWRSPEGVRHQAADGAVHRRTSHVFHRDNVELMAVLPQLREVSYETVAGCRWRCAYCYYPSRSHQLHDDELVRAELAFLCGQRVPEIRICDTRFGGTAERAKDLLRLLREANRGSRIWIYPDLMHVDDEYLQLVRDARVSITSIGIQTTNARALKRVHRPRVQGEAERIRLVLKRFPRVPADVIVGLPGDDMEGLERTFRDVLDFGFASVNVFRLMLFPGTDLGEHPERFFADGGPALNESGQVLCSAEFPRDVQHELASLVCAFEVMAQLPRTRLCLAGRSGDPLSLARRMDPGDLMELNRIMAPEARRRLGVRCGWVIDAMAPVLGDGQSMRDAIAWDLAELNEGYQAGLPQGGSVG